MKNKPLLIPFIFVVIVAIFVKYSEKSNNMLFENFIEISQSNSDKIESSYIKPYRHIVQTDIDSSTPIFEVKSCAISFFISREFENMTFDCVENKKKGQIVDRNCNSILAWTPHPNELNRDNCLIIKSKSENPNQVYRVEAHINNCVKGTDLCYTARHSTCCKFLGPMSQEDLEILASMKEQ